jgi:hypothetical protein
MSSAHRMQGGSGRRCMMIILLGFWIKAILAVAVIMIMKKRRSRNRDKNR